VADPDQRLTDRGRAQAELLSARLAREPVSRIRSSTAPRAVQTAEIVARAFPSIRLSRSEKLLECIPSRPRGALPKHLANRSDADFDRDAARLAALDAWTRPSRAPSVELWVIHGNLIRSLVCRILDLHPGAWWDFGVYHCSVTTVRVDRRARHLIRLNDTGHLPHQLVTQE
jgi:broad specificity phosphatase PhoE